MSRRVVRVDSWGFPVHRVSVVRRPSLRSLRWRAGVGVSLLLAWLSWHFTVGLHSGRDVLVAFVLVVAGLVLLLGALLDAIRVRLLNRT